MNMIDDNRVYIGGIEKREIVIGDYNPLWPKMFKAHAERITQALGNAALRIEHIGSTAVLGLAAKPIIDILLVVQDSVDEASYLPQMEVAGYELRIREPDWHQHRMFRTPEKDVHIHVYSLECLEIDRLILFRDRLRCNSADCERYERMKKRLSQQSWECMDDYAKEKTEVIEDIIATAFSAHEK